jgi:hypothetical protein
LKQWAIKNISGIGFSIIIGSKADLAKYNKLVDEFSRYSICDTRKVCSMTIDNYAGICVNHSSLPFANNPANRNAAPVKPRETLLIYIMDGGIERLSFYNQYKDSPKVLLDAINFYHGGVRSGTSGAGNCFTFGSDGYGQIIPNFAVPRINTVALPKLYASDNTLCLTSKSYYSYTGIDGKSYPISFDGRNIEVAYPEQILGDIWKGVSKRERQNTLLTATILSDLARGRSYFEDSDNRLVKNALANVGIVPGEVRIVVDGVPTIFYLREDGGIRTREWALKYVERYNSRQWLNTHSVGDKVILFGYEYQIDEEGKVHVPSEGFWLNDKCSY